jgi:tRNA 2-selenouridine synthase
MESKKIRKGLQPKGWSPLGPDLFLQHSHQIPIIDVRSPEEFRQGHIPGASNLPLFDDNERVVVGTTYAKDGKDAAVIKGLEIVGPKLDFFVKTAMQIAVNKIVHVHCWRGGMRSEAMAWLFNFSGINTAVLEGGYKAYRRFTRESFLQGPPMIVLGGMTGSGKTEILQYLSEQGEQVIDLEGLAHHKGSAFGALGQPDQPTNEQFENDLSAKWLLLDAMRPVWIEDESRNIGKVIIPEAIFLKMTDAPVVLIDVPFEERVERLVKEYGNFDKDILGSVIEKISKRIGGDVANSARVSLEHDDVREAVSVILKYYDKTYLYGLSKREGSKIKKISFAEFRRGYAEIRRGLEI